LGITADTNKKTFVFSLSFNKYQLQRLRDRILQSIYQLGCRLYDLVSNPVRNKRFFSPPKCPDQN